jgi:hypothetical protein
LFDNLDDAIAHARTHVARTHDAAAAATPARNIA